MTFPTARELKAKMDRDGLLPARGGYGTEYNPGSGQFGAPTPRSKVGTRVPLACCGVGAASLGLSLGSARTGGDEWTDAVAEHYGVTIAWLEAYMAGFDGEAARSSANFPEQRKGYQTGQRHARELGL